jgi:hypothetical protein
MWIPDNSDGRWLVAYSTGNGFTTPSYNSPAIPAYLDGYKAWHNQAQYMQFADFNGDGKMDYMWIPNNGDGRWLVAYSTGNGFKTPSYNSPAIPAYLGGYKAWHNQAQYMRVADFNGDGKMDYMWIPDNGDDRWLVAYSTGNGFTIPSFNAPAIPPLAGGYKVYHTQAPYMQVADFNGDGKMDYMWIPDNSDGRWLMAYSTGTGFTVPSYNSPYIPAYLDGYKAWHNQEQCMRFADFNGDGKMDYMWMPNNGDGRWLSAYSLKDRELINKVSQGLGSYIVLSHTPPPIMAYTQKIVVRLIHIWICKPRSTSSPKLKLPTASAALTRLTTPMPEPNSMNSAAVS